MDVLCTFQILSSYRWFVTIVTRRMSLVKQELPTLLGQQELFTLLGQQELLTLLGQQELLTFLGQQELLTLLGHLRSLLVICEVSGAPEITPGIL
jgi:hypothetical protein